MRQPPLLFVFFFFNDTATTEIYTLSLHDALPIWQLRRFDADFDLPDHLLPEFPPPIFLQQRPELGDVSKGEVITTRNFLDRKSTRLNSSHLVISYAVFCLKKKKTT